MVAFVWAAWPAPAQVRACTTTRHEGLSLPPYDSFNLAMHIGEDQEITAANRRMLRQQLQLPAEPLWCQQMHACQLVVAEPALTTAPLPPADAAVCFDTRSVCVIMTADCLPVFFCDRQGTRVGIAHAGWRGLAQGVLATTVAALKLSPAELMAWLGPAIGPQAYQVGDEVRNVFLQQSKDYSLAFLPDNVGRWRANLYALAGYQLRRLGVGWVGGGHSCTYYDRRFYSFRRNPTTGRMANLIWLRDARSKK